MHFACYTIHGGKRLSGRPIGDADYLQQQRRAQADADCHFAEADGTGARTDCALLCETQKRMWLQARDRPGRLAVGLVSGDCFVRKEHSESRPDDAHESQAGVAAFRRGSLLDALPREPHQVGPGRECGGNAERYFKVAVRDEQADVRILGKTKSDVCGKSWAFHSRNSGRPRRCMDAVDPQAYRRREHRLPDFRRAGFSKRPRRKIHENSLHELHAVCIDGCKLQARLFSGATCIQQFQPSKERLETQGSGRTGSSFYRERFRKFPVQLRSKGTARRRECNGRRTRCNFHAALQSGKIYAGHQLAVPIDGRKTLGARRFGIPEKICGDIFIRRLRRSY